MKSDGLVALFVGIWMVFFFSRVLTTLNLANNQIREQGAAGAAIAEALRGNAVLTTLNLSGDPYSEGGIGPEGASAIAEALKGNGVLKSIDLRVNNLGDEGDKAIRDAVSGREGFKLEM